MLAPSLRHRAWRKINFRRTDTLLAAEFLHGLYQRHNPFLNPFRFATTVVVFRPWEATSYAPVEEWDRLATRFGTRFLHEPDRTCAELDRVLSNDRPRSRELAAELEALSPGGLDDDSLVSTLVRLQHVPLGEIYEVNLVQVEHALHAAARAVVAARAPAGDVDRMLAVLSTSAETTVAGLADADFTALVRRHRAEGGLDDVQRRAALEELVRRHREVGSAYGAETVTLDGMEHRFRQYVELPEDELDGRATRTSTVELDPVLAGDPLLIRLLALLRRTGEVRDRNKQLLGRLTRHRSKLLTEIARRTGVDADDLRLYLLEELIRLAEDGARVPGPIVDRRRRSGVVLRRQEEMVWPDGSGLPGAILDDQAPDARATAGLRGLCAAPGTHTGVIRVVSSAADLVRMQVGDVLVAPGTDFDLILLLRMAGAIVTEEGGLLSHAAVVAREQGIPCVIGVSDATALLRDGELAVVDADSGLVRMCTGDRDEPTVPAPRGEDGGAALVPLVPGLDVDRIGRKAAGVLALRAAGLPTPAPAYVVPVDVCATILAENGQGRHDTAGAVARRIAAAFPETRVALRSSSLAEDTEAKTAAGVYHSEVGIAADPHRLVGVIVKVVASSRGEAARAYHAGRDGGHDAGFALLVTAYQRFDHQGTAVSHSLWDLGHVMVEYFESGGVGGCPDGGGEVVHFAHDRVRALPPVPPIPRLTDDLARVANLTLRLSATAGGPVEVEWGVEGHRIVVLQSRRLAHTPVPV